MRGDGRIFERGTVPWVAYFRHGKEIRESAAAPIRECETQKGRKLTDAEVARVTKKLLKNRLREVANEADAIRPFVGPRQERIKVSEILDDFVAEYKTGGQETHGARGERPDAVSS